MKTQGLIIYLAVDKIKISVLMPVYNTEKYVEMAIQSILDQSFKDFEFIIIDDHSTDSSWEIIQKYAKSDQRIVAHKNPSNFRTTKSLNRGLDMVRGKYVVRMDADDWSYPERLEKQYNFMEANPKVGVSGGAIEICNEDLEVLNVRRYPETDSEVRKIIFRYSPFAHPATIWRTILINKAGRYSEIFPVSQDYELYFRMGKICQFANLPEILIKLRTHKDSSSILRGRSQEQFALYSRIKASMEYGYEMKTFDRMYTFLQILSFGVVPVKIKFWLFNFLRRIY
ncbi:MAG: glycosyl transferase family protein [Microgenomates group bacterium Gr01-1014_5]|nr:MAG: glycosyl transferase family protein [Microgenomates group bacterium Gr01-1014_5]